MALFNNLAILHHVDVVHLVQDMQGMGDQDTGPRREGPIQKAVVQDRPPNVGVDCRQGVVQQDDIGIRVRSSG